MKKLLKFLTSLIIAYGIIVVVLSIFYLFVSPVSTLMLARWATHQEVNYTPASLSHISPHLIRTVIRAEDGRFCEHQGVDWESLEKAINEAIEDKPSRGASTIPMQVSKNLFLWPQQSYIRKAIELPTAMYLSIIWPKARMLEIYLSIAEWGEGIFGAEAAAQKYFHKSARDLSRWEAALLAAALPNPKRRNPVHPSAYHVRYASNLSKWANGNVELSCLR